MSIENNMRYKLHTALRNDFWFQWLEAWATEYQLFKDEKIDPTADFNNVFLATTERLIEISEKFGYTPNLILNSSREFLEQEVLSIAWKIINKTTTRGYGYVFKTMGYQGNVYNLFYDDIRLNKAVNYAQTITALDAHVFSDVFYDLVPDLFFSADDSLIRLDDGNSLDEAIPWELDDGYYYIYSSHLVIDAIADKLITEDLVDYLITPDYMAYLLTGSLYNKKATDVPHAGLQLNCVTDESGYYDNHLISEGPYSVDVIELKSTMTPNYVHRLDAVSNSVFLDESEILDDNPAWTLDAGLSVQGDFDPKTSLQQIVAGTGSLGMPSKFYSGIFDDAPLYYSFDEETGEIVYNLTAGILYGTITGDINRVDSIISRSVNWDGSTYVETPDVVIGVTEYTYSLWYRPDTLPVAPLTECLFEHRGWKLEAVHDGIGGIAIDFNGTTVDTLVGATYLGQDINFILEIDEAVPELRFFTDGTLQDTIAVTITAPGDDLYIGCNNSNTDIVSVSTLDEFMLKYGVMTQGEKDYLYSEKVGALSQLDEEIFRTPLSPSQVHDDVDWIIVHGIIEGVTSKGDILGNGDGVNQVFQGLTELNNIEPGSFRISFQDVYGNLLSAIDDKNGVITGSTFEGVIAYDTGAYDITTYNDTAVIDNLSYSGSATVINFQESLNIVPSTYSVKYNLPGATYIGTDDGAGNITGVNLTGTINYGLGTISLTFSVPTEDGENIYSSYDFRLETWIPVGETLSASYKVTDAVEITEAGIVDEFGRLLSYATFPPVKLDNYNYHLGVNFFIKKLTV